MAAERAEVVYDPTNERVVIAAALAAEVDRRRALVLQVAADEFLVPEHGPIWRALRVLADQGLGYDAQVFRRLVADEGGVEPAYLAALEAEARVPENLTWHVETLRWDATRARVLSGAVPELIAKLRDPKAGADAVSGASRAVTRALDGGGGRRFVRRPEELSRSYRAEIAARRKHGNFWPTGFEAVDTHLTEGVMPGKTWLVAGLSGSGKSTIVGDLVRRLVLGRRRVLYGTWEMGADSMLDVLVAGACRIPIDDIVKGNLSDEQEERIGRVADWFAERVRFMDNAFFGEDVRGKGGGRRSNEKSLDVLEGYVAESGCDVAIYDLWERSLPDLSYDGVTTALYRQQEMHARYNICGVIVHQLKGKEVEQRSDKRPTREAIKGTGAFVETSDVILGVHRDAQFKRVPDDRIELICLKQRKGRANWAVSFDWDGTMGLVTGGVEVPYDPGLENSAEFGDVGDIAVDRGGGRGGKRKPTRRDG